MVVSEAPTSAVASNRLLIAGAALLAASTLAPWYNVTSLAYEPEVGPPPPEIIPNGHYNLWQGLAESHFQPVFPCFSGLFLFLLAAVGAVMVAMTRAVARRDVIISTIVSALVIFVAGAITVSLLYLIAIMGSFDWPFYTIRPDLGVWAAATGLGTLLFSELVRIRRA
ncbi:MAG TPA: hypothetical protein VF807_00980 [Ktedonobacterales bacterium]